jgi:hypothetical protein
MCIKHNKLETLLAEAGANDYLIRDFQQQVISRANNSIHKQNWLSQKGDSFSSPLLHLSLVRINEKTGKMKTPLNVISNNAQVRFNRRYELATRAGIIH